MARLIRNVSFLKHSFLSPQGLRMGLLGTSSQLRNFSSKGKKKSKLDGSDSGEENMSKKDLALKQALDQITTSFGKGSIMWLGRSVSPKQVPVVSTGSFAVDIALGIGGLPNGRVVEIYGPEASGKTTLALHVIAEAQKQGALSLVDTIIRSGSVDVVVVDSVAALVPKGELDREMYAHMAMQARLMSQALRKLSHSLSLSQTILIFINQVRAKLSIAGFGGPTEVTCSGNALKFYASMRLNVRRTGLVKKGDETIGSQVLVKIVKNKHAPPFRTAQFELEFGKGICQESEVIELGCKHKFIMKAGSFFSMNGKNFHGKDALKRHLAENTGVKDDLLMKLREKLTDAELEKEMEIETRSADGGPIVEIISPETSDEDIMTAAGA